MAKTVAIGLQLVQAKKTVIRQVGEGKPITVENTVLTHAMNGLASKLYEHFWKKSFDIA